MNKHQVADTLQFAAYRARSAHAQDKNWIESKARQNQGQALLKHVLSHHFDPQINWTPKWGHSKEQPCKDDCGFTAQEVVNKMDFSAPRHGQFYYNTVYRNYPRLMKLMPELDHVVYNRMVVGYHDPLKIMTHFAVTKSPWSPEFDDQITARFKGNFFNAKDVQDFMSKPKSSRTGMVNRWKSNPAISHMMDILEVWEVMSS